MVEPRFIHLHVHSDYSIVDGIIKIGSLIDKAAALYMPAIAITDFNNLCGTLKFYCSAYKVGIKPIIGADFLIKSDILTNEVGELTLLAANDIGYRHLTLLISEAYKRGYGSSGLVINREWLIKYNKGLILLSGGRKGDIGKLLIRGNMLKVEKCLLFYEKYFPNHYYIELIRTKREDEENYIHAAVDLAARRGIPIVATNDVRFINQEDFNAHEIRVAIHHGFTLNDPKRPRIYSPQQYIRKEEEMCTLFADLPEALTNSVEIAKRCNISIPMGKYFLPKFPTGEISIENYLIKCAQEGLEKRLRFLFQDPKIRRKKRHLYDVRLNVELKVINQMGFPGYFLIVMEFIQWSKNNGIPVGPGRGSGAGSLVAYALNITDLDPLRFDLLFERFLNPERISLPDFDVDFCMEKRDLVIEHVAKTYGRDAVAQIITFGTMTAKAVIRDVGRVLGYPYGFVYQISKLIPQDAGMTLEKALYMEPQLQSIYDRDEEIKILIDMARKLEGIIRNVGKHAGGVVIAPTKITDFSALYCDAKGNHPVTQFDKNDVEYVGLVKFDFLGLRTLTIINWALEKINNRRENQGQSLIDIKTIPLDDKKSFDILQKSETTGVFQLESRGMKDLIKRLQPDCFEDMIALVALFRPGPLQSGMVDNFIDRKHGNEAISYPDSEWQHLSLKSVLDPTYGIILYQEQVMQIAQVLANYTLGGADILRRAMGKKNPREMVTQRSIFKKGAESIGIDGKLSMKIFDLVEKFAGYGFNKSHSAAYALVSYQTLWLKAHYPAEFMAATMTADMDNTEKVVGLVDECLRMNLRVLPPDINTGQYYFYVNSDGEIVYGIGAIKGVGEGFVEEIIKARNKNGKFTDLFDFCMRINIKKINRHSVEKLIMSGAFDRLGSHRAALINNLKDAFKTAIQQAQADSMGQTDMFGILPGNSVVPEKVSNSNITPWSKQLILEGERETIGFYLTGHPITQYLDEIAHYTTGERLKDIHPTENGKIVKAVGLVLSSRIILTKRGNRIGVFTLDDRSGRLDVILFQNVLKQYQHLVEKNRILIVEGEVNLDEINGRLKMTARTLMDLSEARQKYARRLVVSLSNKTIDENFLNHLQSLLEPYRFGTIPVHIAYRGKYVLGRLHCGSDWKVTPSDHLLNDLRQLVGDEHVVLEFK
ncbi:DNA-directed DNA polymerase III PolC [secondary endosymbiont of Heteropsylla cubana]|uniref:DNA polymerase III subunit alpha n=1 Tax=secondary endosymbiont of Heteropsylla cubana TaxID=134287 RepID=J3Z602_9ENTR|nr:DNA polymerase III subunit alpha [secondary endosymbiont of Heteropsylla cubana]AFP85799.1 DNA-directed DNA polymerase III PolC [secondary endosymbiont of Heteropsylla cubana]